MLKQTQEKKVIFGLRDAVDLYKAIMARNNVHLNYAGKVRPYYEKMHHKYFERDYAPFEKENDFGVPIRKQAETLWISDRPFAIVLKESIINQLGIEDNVFHYVTFRKKPIHRWSESINVPKYRGKPGIYLPFTVLEHMKKNMVLRNAYLVVVFGGDGGRIYRIKTGELTDYFIKTIKEKMYINEYGVLNTGISMDLFEEIK